MRAALLFPLLLQPQKKFMDQKDKNAQQNQINIELTDETADGIYSNLAIITHSNQEFVLDFIKVMPGVPKAKVKSRIILTPQHAKRFLRALTDNVRKFESQYGEIAEAAEINLPPMNFGGPTAQA